MRIRPIGVALLFLFALSMGAARAQSDAFGVGASGGLVDAAEREFRFSELHRSDVNAWLEYALEDQVVLRATLGRMNVAAHNAGQSVLSGDLLLHVPDNLRDRVDYGLVSVSYDFIEPAWKSGIFGGVGIYRVHPGNPGAAFAFTPVADAAETVWGLHVGLDAQVAVWHRLSVLGRVTLHVPQTNPHRVLVTADAGFGYRF